MGKIKITILSIFCLTIGMFLSFDIQKVFAEGTCTTAGTKCMDMKKSSDGKDWVDPDGYDCWWEGVCDGSRACCKATTGTAATGTTSASSSAGTTFTNPLAFTTVEGLLGGILSAIQKIIVTLALVFIAIGAVMILVSAGTPDMVERGKKAITMALVGLSLGIAAPSILKELAGFLGWGDAPASITVAMSLSQIALRVLNFLLGITGVLALIMLVIGAITYLTSAGDEDRISSGKKIFRNALIGVIIVMASMVLVRQIALFFAVS